MTTSRPTSALGFDIGQAANATRAVLDRLLAEAGITFADWVALITLAQEVAPPRRDTVRADLAGTLRADVASIDATLGQLTAAGLLRVASSQSNPEDAALDLTPEGRALTLRLRTEIERASAELLSDCDPADVATTRRVLHQVTERANARLARSAT